MSGVKDGRRAVVTGAGKGIGRAITQRLLDDGWSVLGVFNRSAAEAEQLAAGSGRLELVQADLATPEGVAAVIGSVGDAELGALVNNAAIVEFEQEGDYDAELWRRTFAVNLHAPVRLATELAARLRPDGAVVNLCSTDGLRGSYNSMAYAASKAALLSATKSLANVLGATGVRVNAITPGWIDTGMAELIREEASELTPQGRLGRPEEVADCVAWLLSDQSSFINGASIVLDGGLTNVDYTLFKEARKT